MKPWTRAIILAVISIAWIGGARAATVEAFMMDGGRQAIRIVGRMEAPDVAEFAKQIAAVHERSHLPYSEIVVWLNSGGGNMAALDIGELVHTYGMQTYVPAKRQCYSLCAYVWLAGSKRFLGKKAEIGFHMAHAIPGQHVSAEEYMAVNAEIGRYFGSLGMSSAFLEWVIGAGKNIHVLTEADAKNFNIIYSEVQ